MTEKEMEAIKNRWCQVDADLEDLMAEVALLNHEVMGYQVSDGYDKGFEHGQSGAVAEVLSLRAEVERLRSCMMMVANDGHTNDPDGCLSCAAVAMSRATVRPS
jgi:hypothetical protein